MFTMRTTPVEEGTKPYAWNVPSVYQCTWFGYYRAMEAGLTPPVYWDRETRTGSYPNAKEWLKNYREPWEVKSVDYTPVAGDIAVYDGQYGHIQFMETATKYSEYRNGDKNSFSNGNLSDYKGVLLGYLHYPYNSLSPVERNTSVDQIECSDESLRIRTKPSLDGEIAGHVLKGYYNVLSTKQADGYTWYQLSKDRWCANVSVTYLPKDGSTDIIKQIERAFSDMQSSILTLTNDNKSLKKTLKEIHDLSDVDD